MPKGRRRGVRLVNRKFSAQPVIHGKTGGGVARGNVELGVDGGEVAVDRARAND